MIQKLYFSFLYGPYLQSADGIKEFAELCIGKLISSVTKKSAFYREMNENLLVEKANLRMVAERLAEKPVLDAGEYYSVRRRLLASAIIVLALLASSVLVMYAAVTALYGTEAVPFNLAEWSIALLLAIVLVGGGVVAAERLLEALLWQRPVDALPEATMRRAAPLWAVALLIIEIGLLGIVATRAGLLADEVGSGLLHLASLALVMLLPIAGGLIRWDTHRYIDIYKRTQTQRNVETRLAQIDSILRQNEEFESNYYKIQTLSMWRALNDFKALKSSRDARLDMHETLENHFCQSYAAFQTEANWRYEADIRDIQTPSFRRLSQDEKIITHTRTSPWQKLPIVTDGEQPHPSEESDKP